MTGCRPPPSMAHFTHWCLSAFFKHLLKINLSFPPLITFHKRWLQVTADKEPWLHNGKLSVSIIYVSECMQSCNPNNNHNDAVMTWWGMKYHRRSRSPVEVRSPPRSWSHRCWWSCSQHRVLHLHEEDVWCLEKHRKNRRTGVNNKGVNSVWYKNSINPSTVHCSSDRQKIDSIREFCSSRRLWKDMRKVIDVFRNQRISEVLWILSMIRRCNGMITVWSMC